MSRTASAEDYKELGKTYYKQKQYAKALSAFTSAIDVSVVPTVSQYDYRAACHEKLCDFNAAVKDGREAIRTNKRDVRGYLRTASALQQLNRADTALGIYKYGMKNVPVKNKDFEFLQKLHDNLTRKLSPPKAIDPFTVLPAELVELILAQLPFKNIVNMLRVSKGWKNYITRRPKLWQVLDLSQASKPVSRSFVNKAVNYAERDVTKLVIHRFQHTDMLRRIATACKGLREVEVISLPIMLSETFVEMAQCAYGLKKVIVRTDITLDTVMQVLRHRPSLEHVEFHSVLCKNSRPSPNWKGPFPNLHTITLTAMADQNLHRLPGESITNLCPNLRNLSLAGWADMDAISPLQPYPYRTPPAFLTSLELKRMHIPVFPPLPSTLQRLVLHPNKPLKLPSDASTTTSLYQWRHIIGSHVPYLTHLVLREMEDLNPAFLEILLDRYILPEDSNSAARPTENGGAPLEHICLSGVPHAYHSASFFNELGLLRASPRILTSSLQSLSVAGLPCTDDDVEELISTSPGVATSLNTVDISSSKISGASLKMLADGLPNLRYVKADNCRNISSRDAVIYVEKKGVVVSCRMNDGFGASGGKKVRYG